MRILSFVLDLLLVVSFVLIGLSSHDENALAGAAMTLWPFAVGLASGWLAARAWRKPRAIVPTGLVVWVSTVAVGMLLRVLSGQGIQLSFVVVASVVLGVFLVGWRLMARVLGGGRIEWVARVERVVRPDGIPDLIVSSEGGTDLTVAFEPWGGNYVVKAPDFLEIFLGPNNHIEETDRPEANFFQIWFHDEPLLIPNSRGERVSV